MIIPANYLFFTFRRLRLVIGSDKIHTYTYTHAHTSECLCKHACTRTHFNNLLNPSFLFSWSYMTFHELRREILRMVSGANCYVPDSCLTLSLSLSPPLYSPSLSIPLPLFLTNTKLIFLDCIPTVRRECLWITWNRILWFVFLYKKYEKSNVLFCSINYQCK